MADEATAKTTADLPVSDLSEDGVSVLDLALPIVQNLRLLVLGPIVAGAIAFGLVSFSAPVFTARTTFLPPQQPQSSPASALASLGSVASILGGSTGFKSPADQYVALLQSSNVSDRLIDQFNLIAVYETRLRTDARKALADNVRVALGKRDGLITVEVDDHSPQRAADIANRYVQELRRLTGELALTEAQQRRAFFEAQLKQTQGRLATAQQALQASGFNQGALKAEPKAASDSYARLKAEMTAAEVRLQTLRRGLLETTPEVQQQQAALATLRGQLNRLEASVDPQSEGDYVGKYREFKYQETLFELFARQYESARLDESREGALVQVVDTATPPEKKSKPQRARTTLIVVFATFFALLGWVLARHAWRRNAEDPRTSNKIHALRAALRRR